MRRPSQPECHDRHQALAASQNAAVVGGHRRQRRNRLIERFWRVIAKSGRFHRAINSEFGTIIIFWIEARFPRYVKDEPSSLPSRTLVRVCMKPPPFHY